MSRRALRILFGLGIVASLLAGVTLPCAGDILADIVARCPDTPRSYDQVLTYLEGLQGTGRVKLIRLANSPQGRPVPMLVVAAPEPTPSGVKTLFLIARQHGDEPSGTTAALALAEHFAVSQGVFEREILKRLTFVIVPVANPDGMAANRRANGKGVDLNRDWVALSQPETRAIAEVVGAWRPDAILDLHELPAVSSRSSFRENFLETVGSSQLLPAGLWTKTLTISRDIAAWMRYYRYGFNIFYDYPGDSLNLCHRYFGLGQGYPAFLCEAKTGPGRTLKVRAGVHILGALVVGNYLINSDSGQPSLPPQQVAEKLPSEQLVTPAPPEPPQVVLHVSGEHADSHPQRMEFEAEVLAAERFCYMTIQVDGQVRVLCNSPIHAFAVDTSDMSDGTHAVLVQAHAASGQTLAEQGCELTVEAGRPLVAK